MKLGLQQRQFITLLTRESLGNTPSEGTTGGKRRGGTENTVSGVCLLQYKVAVATIAFRKKEEKKGGGGTEERISYAKKREWVWRKKMAATARTKAKYSSGRGVGKRRIEAAADTTCPKMPPLPNSCLMVATATCIV